MAFGLALLAAGCGPLRRDGEAPQMVAQFASYETVAGPPQRILVGLSSSGAGLVGFGTVMFTFSYFGNRGSPQTKPTPKFSDMASYRPIPGQDLDLATPGPRIVLPSKAIGVYGVDGVRFDAPGFWRVTATAKIAGHERRADAAFEVVDQPRIPAPGGPAPRVENPLPGAAGVHPSAIDSRADDSTPVPDPELHATTVAAAIAAGRPLMVVVSTPTYCTSRFCGPITDSVATLARRWGERMAFVHLEVWEDFQAKELNAAAAAWIYPPGAEDAREPWVFTVDAHGLIVDRFDNVATDAELSAAVQRLLG